MRIIKFIIHSLPVYIIVIVALAYSFWTVEKTFEPKSNPQDYGQPPALQHWEVNSIDTQIISKHWLNVPQSSIETQVKMLKDLNVNYISVVTPYDREPELAAWVTEIHKQGLHVWFRSHWDGWEGDDGKPASMSPQEYLDQTYAFIESNPELFKEGDAFTAAVEAEQVGVGLGKRFLTWNDYREFLLDEIDYSNRAFKKIGLEHKVYTNWLSANAWVVKNQFTEDLVSKIDLIVVDHYAEQSQTIGKFENPTEYSKKMSEDLDNLYAKWKVPILVGEWGYQIHQDVSEQHQLMVVEKVMQAIKNKPYIVGFNYWAHMGNHSRIIQDDFGANLRYRLATNAIREMFK